MLSLVGLFVVVIRGLALWRQAKRTSAAFGDELALFEERSARDRAAARRGRPLEPGAAGGDGAAARLARAAERAHRVAGRCAAAHALASRLPAGPMSRVAAVDLGTNSTRLLVADVDDGRLEEVSRRLTITRLGEGVDERRRLLPLPIARVRNCLADYRRELETLGAERTLCIATSSVRDAENGEAFLGEIEWSYGFTTRLLSGDGGGGDDDPRRHQRTAAAATTRSSSTSEAARPSSCSRPEGEVAFSTSLDVGCVRLTERYLASDPPSRPELAAAERLRALAASAARGGGRDRRRGNGDDARDARPRGCRVRPGAHARPPPRARVRRGAARTARAR